LGDIQTFWTSARNVGEWSASRPGRFTPKERAPDNHWTGGWVGIRADGVHIANLVEDKEK